MVINVSICVIFINIGMQGVSNSVPAMFHSVTPQWPVTRCIPCQPSHDSPALLLAIYSVPGPCPDVCAEAPVWRGSHCLWYLVINVIPEGWRSNSIGCWLINVSCAANVSSIRREMQWPMSVSMTNQSINGEWWREAIQYLFSDPILCNYCIWKPIVGENEMLMDQCVHQ